MDRNRAIRTTHLADQGHEPDLEATTPAERIGMMWQLALNAWALTEDDDAQSQLPRDVVRVVRGRQPAGDGD